MHPLGPPVIQIQHIPPAPLTRSFNTFPLPVVPPPRLTCSGGGENLNPNVPEFVPFQQYNGVKGKLLVFRFLIVNSKGLFDQASHGPKLGLAVNQHVDLG